jgi:hypothetical protein
VDLPHASARALSPATLRFERIRAGLLRAGQPIPSEQEILRISRMAARPYDAGRVD